MAFETLSIKTSLNLPDLFEEYDYELVMNNVKYPNLFNEYQRYTQVDYNELEVEVMLTYNDDDEVVVDYILGDSPYIDELTSFLNELKNHCLLNLFGLGSFEEERLKEE